MQMFKPLLSLSLIFVLFISSCGILQNKEGFSSRNWNGSDTPGHTYAKFEYLNGPQEFDVKLDKEGPFNFKYAFGLSQGSIVFTLQSGSRTLLNQTFSGNATDSLTIKPEPNEKFKMILKATNAQGNFDLKYSPIND